MYPAVFTRPEGTVGCLSQSQWPDPVCDLCIIFNPPEWPAVARLLWPVWGILSFNTLLFATWEFEMKKKETNRTRGIWFMVLPHSKILQ